ncbi:hypothetical protein ACFX13_025661 [Malus domestica]
MAVGAEHEVVLLGDEVVDVIEAVGEVGGDLHPREPRRQDSVAWVLPVAEAVGEVGAGDEFVNEISRSKIVWGFTNGAKRNKVEPKSAI